ncbi:hypothetical protein [Solimonas sp. SE-A11]|uniref:hypothetical protein n=1 Tax=Solimonas sp. SE-A11 TaxID=3054954 RepID=UPI00259C8BD1|nr:hypothetical protein [Solimonas sp. SE-A11]MDM4772750.1 hypothetical protein [Solimonas sp. SE-A11]
MTDMRGDVSAAAAKSGPPVLAFFSGVTVHDLVGWLTLAYLGLQAVHLLWKWRRELRSGA